MSKIDLPKERVINSAFKEKGRENVVKIEIFSINDGEVLKLTFESINSPWRQGVWMKTDEHLLVDKQQCPSIELWNDTAPKEVMIKCHTKSGRLHLYNIWDSGRGMGIESQSWSSGMIVEEIENGRRYCCNDIGFQRSFDKLVFRIERA